MPEPLDAFFFDPPYRNLVGSAREGKAIVVNLTVGRDIKQLSMPGLPHLGFGNFLELERAAGDGDTAFEGGQDQRAGHAGLVPDQGDRTPGPGFFMRSHENSPYAWTDAMMGPKKDTMSIIDKRTLEIVRTVTPAPNKTAAHVEFDRNGRYALVSIWENEGALVIYDAATFAEIKRIPMSRPSGKYNVWNKINFSDGTSH